MLAQLIVLLILVSLIGLGVFAFRKSRSMQGEVEVALADFGQAVGATFDPKTRSFTGTLDGHAVTVVEAKQGTGGEYEYFVRMTVATTPTATLELLPQRGGFVPTFVTDLKTGDADFDRWFVVRGSDPAAVQRVLTPDRRRQLLEWQTSGWLWELRVRDGALHFAGGQGLFRRDQVEKTLVLLRAMVELTEALEAAVTVPARS